MSKWVVDELYRVVVSEQESKCTSQNVSTCSLDWLDTDFYDFYSWSSHRVFGTLPDFWRKSNMEHTVCPVLNMSYHCLSSSDAWTMTLKNGGRKEFKTNLTYREPRRELWARADADLDVRNRNRSTYEQNYGDISSRERAACLPPPQKKPQLVGARRSEIEDATSCFRFLCSLLRNAINCSFWVWGTII